MSVDETHELVKLSQMIWDMQKYFERMYGQPCNLERGQRPEDLLKQVASLVDKTIVKVIPEEQCVTPQLRRANKYCINTSLGC